MKPIQTLLEDTNATFDLAALLPFHRAILTHIVTGDNCGNDSSLVSLDFTEYSGVESISIGNHCFSYVKTVTIAGLAKLKSVMIGKKCFMDEQSLDGRFQLKNCSSMGELRVGERSFMFFSACEIEDNPSMTLIEMEKMDNPSYSFWNGSLELKSVVVHNDLGLDMASLKSLECGESGFQGCSSVVLESGFSSLE